MPRKFVEFGRYIDKDNISLVISVLALCIGILSYYTSANNSMLEAELESNDLIYSAWDDLGGRDGSEYFDKPISTYSLNKAARKVDKALKLYRKNQRAIALHAILLYHNSIQTGDKSKMEKASEILEDVLLNQQFRSESASTYYIKSLIQLRSLDKAKKYLSKVDEKNGDLEFLTYEVLYTKSWLQIFTLEQDWQNVEKQLDKLKTEYTEGPLGRPFDKQEIKIQIALAGSYLEQDKNKTIGYLENALTESSLKNRKSTGNALIHN
ncbi:hypothetical protein [Methylomonas sp. AM2-LC]|uniref:hypothetical protein n=1 Tax=Methylomonas sp. AM2-LC TaxID=3153301 RepID=UPI003263D922